MPTLTAHFILGWRLFRSRGDAPLVSLPMFIVGGASQTTSTRRVALGAGIVVLVLGGMFWFSARPSSGPSRVVVPELSTTAEAGKRTFARSCAQCHGEDAGGSSVGPPLVHRLYESRHHADVSFELAVRRGVRAHHWQFGDMPPQPSVTQPELLAIIRYVRELQKANGID